MDSNRLLDGRLKMRHLTMVVAIADHGGVTRAADELHLTQPVVTRALRELEEILGVSLFERGPRGVTVTAFGAAFVEDARAIIRRMRQAARRLDALAAEEGGTVAVGTHLTGTDGFLPRAIHRLKRSRPRVVVELVEAPHERLVSQLSSGVLDIVVGRVDMSADIPCVRQVRLYTEGVKLVVRAGHPAAAQPDVTLDALRGYPWIFPGAETAVSRELFAAFADRDLAPPEDRIISTSLSVPEILLLESDAVAALPGHMALDDGRFQVLQCDGFSLDRTVGVLLPQERSMTPTAVDFMKCLRMEAGKIREAAGAGAGV
ncbi:LysR substrate-binding domain-containing protein [Streptomyces sp. NBC_01221]|uniref:LysR substrate-binding domain-containing protein n=1 Tax=Streptomyces sp. NBC_01221 TaxID=2903782 RepID=UPI0022568AC4|nr:LysR substrate-binding domain-containing protein [Streptomyces sp. NBC_01221]MCX4792315.1 LysR substrate-binding domain-containing protein [Streptomyces sp. NBC_01221]